MGVLLEFWTGAIEPHTINAPVETESVWILETRRVSAQCTSNSRATGIEWGLSIISLSLSHLSPTPSYTRDDYGSKLPGAYMYFVPITLTCMWDMGVVCSECNSTPCPRHALSSSSARMISRYWCSAAWLVCPCPLVPLPHEHNDSMTKWLIHTYSHTHAHSAGHIYMQRGQDETRHWSIGHIENYHKWFAGGNDDDDNVLC